jgi:hypothetical protein
VTGWQPEDRAAFLRKLPAEVPLGPCAVCGAPVYRDHDPVAVVWSDGTDGIIHGAFDCTDERRCEELDQDRRCVLPRSHTGAGLRHEYEL